MGHELVALGSAFIAAGLLGKFGRRLGLPTVPFFIGAGLLLGVGMPGLALAGDPEWLELLAALGLVLLLFHLGLEFDLDGFLKNARALLAAGAGYIVLNVGAGFLLGLSFGWGVPEALVIAGVTGISSSAIVTKVLIEFKRLTKPETPLILGVMVVEDVFLALYLAVLSPVLGQAEGGTGSLVRTLAVAFTFLLVLVAVARWGGRHVGRVIGAREDELLTVMFVGVAVLFAGLAEEVGVSDAIGAFLIGLVVAATVYRERVQQLALPLRDAFAAIFFFAFGLSLDPGAFGSVVGPVAIAAIVTLVANIIAGLVAARLNGFGLTAGINAGLTLLSRGEFALILAALAAGAGLDARIGPFVGLYVVTLAVAGPLLASQSEQIGGALQRAVDRRGRRRPPPLAGAGGVVLPLPPDARDGRGDP